LSNEFEGELISVADAVAFNAVLPSKLEHEKSGVVLEVVGDVVEGIHVELKGIGVTVDHEFG